VVELVPLALVITVSPLSIIPAVLVLHTPTPARAAWPISPVGSSG